MSYQEADAILNGLQEQSQTICDIASVAKRHGKSIGGRNPYGERFHNAVVGLSKLETTLGTVLSEAGVDKKKSAELYDLLGKLKAITTELGERIESLKAVQLICQATLLPAIEGMTVSSVPRTEHVLPLDLIRPTGRKYIEKIVIQANGCYEHQWYDACSVMIRRLLETVIIELYEARRNAAEIKTSMGEFVPLSGLVDAVLASDAWNLGREVKKTLPDIKLLGDRSAHTRHYNATKRDVDKIIPGFRVAVEQLLHLAGLL